MKGWQNSSVRLLIVRDLFPSQAVRRAGQEACDHRLPQPSGHGPSARGRHRLHVPAPHDRRVSQGCKQDQARDWPARCLAKHALGSQHRRSDLLQHQVPGPDLPSRDGRHLDPGLHPRPLHGDQVVRQPPASPLFPAPPPILLRTLFPRRFPLSGVGPGPNAHLLHGPGPFHS